MANNETKNDLTRYLAEKLVAALAIAAYATVFSNTSKINIDINENLFSYNQDKRNTGILLHALDGTQKNSYSEYVISCFDIDVLLILLHHFDDICSSTTFKTRNKETYSRPIYETLEKEICKVLPGFHSFTGCNQTEDFIDTRSSFVVNYSYHQLHLCEMFSIISDFPEY